MEVSELRSLIIEHEERKAELTDVQGRVCLPCFPDSAACGTLNSARVEFPRVRTERHAQGVTELVTLSCACACFERSAGARAGEPGDEQGQRDVQHAAGGGRRRAGGRGGRQRGEHEREETGGRGGGGWSERRRRGTQGAELHERGAARQKQPHMHGSNSRFAVCVARGERGNTLTGGARAQDEDGAAGATGADAAAADDDERPAKRGRTEPAP